VTTNAVIRCAEVLLGQPSAWRLRDVTLTFPPGLTAVVGPSGAGKTSLLNVLVGFEHPTAGTVSFEPTPSGALPWAWAPPDDGLWPHLTVREHLAAVLPESIDDSERAAVIDDHLSVFGLVARAAAYPATLSRGERSRLSVARALASGARVLVCDEPLSHVEPELRDRIWAEVVTRLRSTERYLIFATHEPHLALRDADWVVLLEGGRVLAEGPPRALYRHPTSAAVATALGPAVWLTLEEYPRWFVGSSTNGTIKAGVAVRPHQIRTEADAGSSLVVTQAMDCGAWIEVELKHEPTGAVRRFTQSQPATVPHVGLRVVLRHLLWVWVMLGLCGCGVMRDPVLTPTATDFWTIPPEDLKIPAPRAISATADDDVFVLDNVGRVLRFDTKGRAVQQWWMPEYTVGKPERILKLRDGRIVVTDTHYHRIVLFDAEGQVATMFGRKGEAPGEFIYPVAVTEDDRGRLYICEYGGHDRVQIFQPDGTYVAEFGSFGSGPGQFQRPSGIVWREGRLYIADAFNNRLHVVTEEGTADPLRPGAFAADLHYPYDLAVSPEGTWWVAEYGAGRVTAFSAEGQVLGRYGQTGENAADLNTPWSVTVDRDGRVLVADTGNRRIVSLDFAGGP
jgi:ABC-type Fe3+/spermidine/putrescine transport system ATPase subunit/sugar lactone lactonase YvrE